MSRPVRVSIYQDGQCSLVRLATVNGLVLKADQNPDQVTFTESGPAVQAGNEYVACPTTRR